MKAFLATIAGLALLAVLILTPRPASHDLSPQPTRTPRLGIEMTP